MDEKSNQIQQNFNSIKELKTQVMLCFNALEIKQKKLKATTLDFVSNNKDNLFIFGLDSFQFQSKLIDYEYNDMKKYYFALNNRMYCEYYKLYKLILVYVEETIGTNKNIELLKLTNVFPVYKDLEPFKQYDFEMIIELHKTVLVLLNDLNDYITDKENQLKIFITKQQAGLNINNFVNTYDFDIIVMRQKRTLYLSYLEFFHNIHTKHFRRFAKKMKLMNDYLEEDIQFDDGTLGMIESFSSDTQDETENIIIGEQLLSEKKDMKTFFKRKIKNVLNVLRLTNNKEKHHEELLQDSNINDLLNSLTIKCDRIIKGELPLTPLNKVTSPTKGEQQDNKDNTEVAIILEDNCVPVEVQVEAQVETHVETHVETPVEVQVETPVEVQVETPVEVQVETSVETPVEAQVETPVEVQVEVQVEPIISENKEESDIISIAELVPLEKKKRKYNRKK